MFSAQRDEARIAEGKASYVKALGTVEEYFLARGTSYIAADHPTTADIQIAVDLSQILMIDDAEFNLSAFPKVKAVWDAMRSQPHFAAVHEGVMTRKKIDF